MSSDRNDAIWPEEDFFVCYLSNSGKEVIVQSEKTSDRAEYSVEILNEQERNNARPEKFYWRPLKEGEIILRGRKKYS